MDSGFLATINKLEVHYRFLSAFVHPVSDVTDLIYGRNQFDLPIYDHYSSELKISNGGGYRWA
jgi:hypothetical protein